MAARYLVTGGCGFIGSHLADALLARGDEVVILDDLSTGRIENRSPGANLIEGDVADPAAVATAIAGVDGCFHLAAIASVERSMTDWLATHRTNLTGTITVLDAARRANAAAPVPVVYASSAAVYGDNGHLPLGEDETPRPLSAYGADKLGSESHAAVAQRVHGVPTTGLRFFNVFGPRQDPHSPYSGVISIFSERLAARQPVAVFGDGEQTRDFVYVADVVSALLAAMRHPRPEPAVFNICTGRATSIRALAQAIGELCGISPRIETKPPRAGDIRHSLGDPRRAKERLGFEAQTTLRDGLRQLLASRTG